MTGRDYVTSHVTIRSLESFHEMFWIATCCDRSCDIWLHDLSPWLSCDPLQGFTPPMLVFVQSIERAKELFHELIYDGLNVDVIHSERTQAQRDNVVKCFRTGKV